MKHLDILALLLAILLLISCAGTEENEKDKIPPYPPSLVPHLGDTGDPPAQYNGHTVILNEDNNGIDTVPDGDWIRLLWDPFIDTDLSHIKIYRYDQFNTNPVMIDSISANATQYLDSQTQLTPGVWYSYYIDLVDFSGNYATSDTVSYSILSKCVLLSPDNNALISPISATFQWNRSGFASTYRLLLFDEDYNYVWHQDLVVANEEDPLSITIPVNLASQYSGQSLRWRVDSLEWNEDMQMYQGSESLERIVWVQ
jgi:hypothetical protein